MGKPITSVIADIKMDDILDTYYTNMKTVFSGK